MSPPRSLTLSGTALHAGTPCEVRFVRCEASSPIRLCVGEVVAAREQLVVVRNDRGVMVRLGEHPGAPTVDLVEHLFAALGGLGIVSGLRVEITGGEVPLLDGGAAELVRALAMFELPSSDARVRVLRPFEWIEGETRYSMDPAERPSLEVLVDFAHPEIGKQACAFAFEPRDFVERIAPARTFGFARDWPTLLAQGRARGVDPRSVRVFEDVDPSSVEASVTDEPARHKLLDFLGDCALLGGPFHGALRASRPGHRATHAFLSAAWEAGALG